MTELLHFTADWCQPCKKIKPLIDDFINQNPDIIYSQVNIEEEFDTVQHYNVMSIPTLIVIKDGKVYSRHTGMATSEKIESLFE